MTRILIVPAVVVFLAPLAYLAQRAGLLQRPWFRWWGGVLACALLFATWPRACIGQTSEDYLRLLIAAAGCLLLLLRTLCPPWLTSRRQTACLGVLAGLSLVVYYDFFNFHTDGRFAHSHDIAHYYLGSKYFGELGYDGLYNAVLQADAESNFRLVPAKARDLASGEVVPSLELVSRSERTKSAFGASRWSEFRNDVACFRKALGPRYPAFLQDHGYNPTPVWTVIGATIANQVPCSGRFGIAALAVVDPVLIAGALGAVGWAFGIDAMLLCVLHWTLIFGASFGWTGGAFLRYMWFFGVVVAACCLKKGRFATAGVLLALASDLRIFPAFFALGLALRTGWGVRRERSLPSHDRRFFGAFVAAAAGLFLSALLLPQGLGSWALFARNTTVQLASLAPNVVGLRALASNSLALLAPHVDLRIPHLVIVALVLLLVALLARRAADEVSALALGIPLAFAAINLSGYYYVFLILFTLANRERPLRLLGIFGLELATYALELFEPQADQGIAIYVYREILLGFLFVSLYWDDAVREIAESRLAWARRRVPAARTY